MNKDTIIIINIIIKNMYPVFGKRSKEKLPEDEIKTIFKNVGALSLNRIVLSICLSFSWGVFGVLIATSISRACFNLWYDPWLIHRDGFHCSVKPFFLSYLKRIALLIAITVLMQFISCTVLGSGVTIPRFVAMVCITAVVPNAIMILLYHRTEEYRFFTN